MRFEIFLAIEVLEKSNILRLQPGVRVTVAFSPEVALSLAAYSRPFSMERLKAWWNGKPEPKGEAKSESYVAPAE